MAKKIIVDDNCGYANTMYAWLLNTIYSANDTSVANVRRLDYFGLGDLEGELRAKAEVWKLKNEFSEGSVGLSKKTVVAL